MRIIGITGTLGAGKGTVAEYLKSKGFKHYSAREAIAEEVRKRALPVDRDTLRETANQIRTEHGGDYFFGVLWEKAQAGGGDAVIESMRVPEGCRSLRKAGGRLLAVDADPRIRYDRVRARSSETDLVSFEKFLEDENKEMNVAGEHLSDLAACMALADATVMNNDTLEELHAQVDRFLSQLP